jgi:diguanylate cyclase (GGDEF)-like protein
VTRYGGEEFAVLVAGVGSDRARELGESLRASVEQMSIEHRTSPASSVVTISVGIATMIPDGNDEAATLLEAADEALYAAKNTGRHRVAHMPASAQT